MRATSVLLLALTLVLASCTPPAAPPSAPAKAGQKPLATTPSGPPAAQATPAAQAAPTKADGRATPLKELVIGAPVEPPSISALSVIGSHFPEHTPIHLLFDSLIQLRPDGTAGPKLAEKWDVSPDRLAYTFALRPSAKFHDGTPVTAEDVRFTFDTLNDPNVKNIDRQGLENVVGTDVIEPAA